MKELVGDLGPTSGGAIYWYLHLLVFTFILFVQFCSIIDRDSITLVVRFQPISFYACARAHTRLCVGVCTCVCVYVRECVCEFVGCRL